MKTVYTVKENYGDNFVKVIFFEKDATREVFNPILNEKTGSIDVVKITEIYDKHLHCEKFSWIETENEIDERVEQARQEWETRINS